MAVGRHTTGGRGVALGTVTLLAAAGTPLLATPDAIAQEETAGADEGLAADGEPTEEDLSDPDDGTDEGAPALLPDEQGEQVTTPTAPAPVPPPTQPSPPPAVPAPPAAAPAPVPPPPAAVAPHALAPAPPPAPTPARAKPRPQEPRRPTPPPPAAREAPAPARAPVTAPPVAPLPAERPAPVRAPRPEPVRDHKTHRVASGQTLWTIARALAPDADTREIAGIVARLWRLNADRIGTGDPDLLHPGVVLVLPDQEKRS